MAVFLDFYECAFLFEVFYYLLSCSISVHTCICRIVVNDSSIVVHNIDNRKVMTETYFKVVRVVCRSYLNNACSEVHFNVVISYDRYLSVNEREDNRLAYEVFIALVSRIYSYGSISEKCLRTCCCKLEISVAVLYLIAEVPEMTCLILVCDLSV